MLPTDNRLVCFHFFELMKLLCENHEKTRLTPKALAICFAPSLSGRESGQIFLFETFFTLCIDQLDTVFSVSTHVEYYFFKRHSIISVL